MQSRGIGLTLSRRTALMFGGSTLFWSGIARAAGNEEPIPTYRADQRDQSFDAGWRFFKGDNPFFASRDFQDGAWRSVELPHDWSIEDLNPSQGPAVNAVVRPVDTAAVWEPAGKVPPIVGPFHGAGDLLGASSASSGGRSTGYTVGGIGWYRKHFRIDRADADSMVEIVFDGVYMNAEIWLNGSRIAGHAYGYTPFAVDLTPHLDPSGENVLAVRVANLGKNSRWYSGSGIYRHVKLNCTAKSRFQPWGLRVTTPAVDETIADVRLTAQLSGAAGSVLVAEIRDMRGRPVAKSEAPVSSDQVELALRVPTPARWSPDTPHLYTAHASIRTKDGAVDKVATTFGIRTIEVDAANGFRLNGKGYKLRGGCMHHDNGLLGAIALARAEERKIELLKARGFNAVRMSHNPPSQLLLDACDRLGMLVIGEAFDSWNVPKNPEDYSLYFAQQWRDDLTAMVARDGNHPSIVIWSIGNEIPEKTEPHGVATARMLTDELHRLDPTRPVTQGINGPNGPATPRSDGTADEAATAVVDIAGYNYKSYIYRTDHKNFPKRIVVGTESFPRDVARDWLTIEDLPNVIGDFVWTAMDYLGEVGLAKSDLVKADAEDGPYPWINAFCGDIDLIGQQKPQSLLRDVVWGVSPVEMAVQRPIPEGKTEKVSYWGWRDELQSWSWKGSEGRPLNVSVYTKGDRVRLLLNGNTVGEKQLLPKDGSTARFDVPYAPGRLVAIVYSGAKRLGQAVLETTGPAVALRAQVDRRTISASRDDLAYVTIEAVDAKGRVVPEAVHVVKAALAGSLELSGFGNANPRGVASFRQPVAKTWHGRALLIVRPTSSGRGMIELSSEGLASALVHLSVDDASKDGLTA